MSTFLFFLYLRDSSWKRFYSSVKIASFMAWMRISSSYESSELLLSFFFGFFSFLLAFFDLFKAGFTLLRVVLIFKFTADVAVWAPRAARLLLFSK